MIRFKKRTLDNDVIKTVVSFYLPGLFVQIGSALTITFQPLYAASLGANIRMIGFIAAATGIGSILFDMLGMWLSNKIKEKHFLFLALTGMSVFSFIKGIAGTPHFLMFCSFGYGFFYSAWGVGRLGYIRTRLPKRLRGRALSGMGGIMRVSKILFPVLGGLSIKFLGYRSIFIAQSIILFAALVSMLVFFEQRKDEEYSTVQKKTTLRHVIAGRQKSLIAAMVGITGLQLLRISRDLLYPLWADYIGISVEMIGLLSGVGGIVETLMVVPAGIVIDRFGRKFSAIPCIMGLSIAILLLPFTHSAGTLTIVIVLMSLANGIGSGINMTISTDLAPKHEAARFLSLWRLVTDTSQITAPTLAGYIAHALSLVSAPICFSILGLVAGFVMLFGMEETGETKGHTTPDNQKKTARETPDGKRR